MCYICLDVADADAFPIPLNFFSDRTRCDFVLSLHANTGISPNQEQHELTLRVFSGVLNLSSKEYEANYFD